MSGDEDVDLAGILAHALSQAGVGEDLIEGVADVFVSVKPDTYRRRLDR